MPIVFRCPGCSSLNKVGDEAAGKAVRCGKCQAVLTVPAAPTPAEAAPAPAIPEPAPPAPVVKKEIPQVTPGPPKTARRREDDTEDAPRPRRRRDKADEEEGQELPRPRNLLKARQNKKSRVGLVIALTGVGLLAGCGLCSGIGWYFYSQFYSQVAGADAIYDGGGPEAKTLPPLEDVRDGKFTRPPRATTPTSYFRMVSSKGDYIGGGKTYSISGNEVTVRKSAHGLTVGAGEWHADFYGAGTQLLKPGEYPNAHRTSNGDAPGIDVNGQGRGCNQTSGKFIIWEMGIVGDQVISLAIDFLQQCEGNGPPLYGRVRYNSTFQ
jgi:hypothetical protein